MASPIAIDIRALARVLGGDQHACYTQATAVVAKEGAAAGSNSMWSCLNALRGANGLPALGTPALVAQK
jgi:hypothetical protein